MTRPEIDDGDLNNLYNSIDATKRSETEQERARNADNMMGALDRLLNSPRTKQGAGPDGSFTPAQKAALRTLYGRITDLLNANDKSREAEARWAYATALKQLIPLLEPAFPVDVLAQVCEGLVNRSMPGPEQDQTASSIVDGVRGSARIATGGEQASQIEANSQSSL